MNTRQWLRVLVLGAVALAYFATPAAAQVTGSTISVRDSGTGALVPNVGDTANNAVRVNIVAGGGSGGTSSSFGAAFPATGTAAGFSDGTNMQAARVVDADTGAGTIYAMVNNLVRRASGGPVELIGQATMVNSLPVTFASDQSALAVNATQTGTWTVQPGNTANTTAWLTTGTGGTFPSTQSGVWTVQPGNTANTTAWLVKELSAATSALTNVVSSATNVACLASNAARLGATIFNDSTQPVFAKFGAVASATSFTYKVEGGGTLEVPFGYTGLIDCIWSSANGNARVTEISQ